MAVVALNENAQVDHWPVTGQPVHRAPMAQVLVNCGNSAKFGEFMAMSVHSEAISSRRTIPLTPPPQ